MSEEELALMLVPAVVRRFVQNPDPRISDLDLTVLGI
jgi:hypothetical protein